MKTLKTTIAKTKHVFMALVIAFTFSCSPEDGMNGLNGMDGEQGQTGNANVQSFTFDISTETGAAYSIDSFIELTESVLDNDAILTFIKRTDLVVNGNNVDTYFPIPGISLEDMIEVELSVGNMNLYFYDKNNGGTITPPTGRYETVRAVIIKSTNTSGRFSNKQNVYKELELSGVDINNYYDVCNYYGISY